MKITPNNILIKNQTKDFESSELSSRKEFWANYCKLNYLDNSFPFFLPLKHRVINSFSNFFSSYNKKVILDIIQNTTKSKLFKNLTLTKKNVNNLMERIIALNPGINIVIFLYYELHSCWKKCHWKDGIIFNNFFNHSKLICQCFPNSSKKHWKCQRKWHIHSWHNRDLILPIEKETKFEHYLEEIADKEKRISYNMKDWKNFYVYPKVYREAGLNFKKQWYWVLDSEKHLQKKEKKKILNQKYWLNKKLSGEKIHSTYLNEKLKKRRSLLRKKYYLESLLKKLSWSKKNKRNIILKRIQKIKFELAISK